MANSNSVMIHKLQRAINAKGEKILVNKNQFYSEKQDRPITIYTVKKAVYDQNKGKSINVELFSSTSEIQIVLFLRDYWYQLNGIEIPADNEEWNKAKESYDIKHRF